MQVRTDHEGRLDLDVRAKDDDGSIQLMTESVYDGKKLDESVVVLSRPFLFLSVLCLVCVVQRIVTSAGARRIAERYYLT